MSTRALLSPWARGLLAALSLLALLAAPLTAWAAPVVTGLLPGSVSNLAPVTLILTGSGFEANSVVVVDGVGALATTLVTGATPVLTAVLPAGVPPGAYTVRVVNPDGSAAAAPAPLTVTGPTATPAPTAYVRPLLVVESYTASSTSIPAYSDLDFEMTLLNAGQGEATNITATFPSGDFVPRVTGGVRALGALGPGQRIRFWQPLTSGGIAGQNVAALEVRVSYTDPAGNSYSESFTLTFPVQSASAGPAATRTPTPTPTAVGLNRPQVLVGGYQTDVTPLQPGTRFRLKLDVLNVGSTEARQLTLIVGGGSPAPGATPGAGPGGVSGSGGDFTNFAPVESSNVQFLGSLAPAGRLPAEINLIVNSSTKAGAYPLKISFLYVDARGSVFVDDQVVTLLVYQLPVVELSFYRDPGPFFAGQQNIAPVQVVNLGRTAAIFGNLRVTGSGAQYANNTVLVGALDPGGYFTLDAAVIPDQPGPLELMAAINFTDDFGQPQVISQTLTVEVLEGGGIEPPLDGGGGFEPPPVEPETFWQAVWRFVRGLLGLDSGRPGQGETPLPGEPQPPLIAPAGGKG